MAFMGKGLTAVKDVINKSTEQLKMKSGESKVIRIVSPMDEVISVWEHTEQIGGQWHTITCLGKNECPLCQAGMKAQFKVYLLVLDREDNKVKIFKIGKKLAIQVLGLVEEYGDLTQRDFKVTRTGEKLETVYQFFARDPQPEDLSKYELPDVESIVAPMPREAILKIMEGGVTVAQNQATNTAANDDNFPF